MQIFAFMHRSDGKKSAQLNQKVEDSYQDSLNLQGKEQFKKLLKQGIQIQMGTSVA